MERNVYIETLGCAKNRVDSEIMITCLLRENYCLVREPEEAEVIILNTCAFITKAVNESLERILSLVELKKKGRCRSVIVVGCLTERYKEELLKEIPEVNAVLGTSDYTKVVNVINETLSSNKQISVIEKQLYYSENNFIKNRLNSTGRGFAYLKIAEGCSNMCSFCNIPMLRGRYRSKPIEIIRREFDELVQSGTKEINIISQDCSSYGADLKNGLGLTELIKTLLDKEKDDFWIRLFYLYPNRFPINIINIMNEDSRLVPYIDLPVQHISNPVLKRMNRKITGNEIEKIIDKIVGKKPDIAIRTTLMVGFPGEDESDFKKLLELVRKGYFMHLGVFEYSAEDNIGSKRFEDDVSERTKKERRDLLMEAQQEISMKKIKDMVGQNQKVLIEGEYEETSLLLKGRNQYQGPEVDGLVLINEGIGNVGNFNTVEVVDSHTYDLIGKLV